VGRPFDERAASLIELLKMPPLTNMTNTLLERLRREEGADVAAIPTGGTLGCCCKG
jgi:hypothetical protein